MNAPSVVSVVFVVCLFFLPAASTKSFFSSSSLPLLGIAVMSEKEASVAVVEVRLGGDLSGL